jgi:hypothetical protein
LGFSNEGLGHLEKRSGLKALKIYGTEINDDGLGRLVGLNNLRFVQLWQDSPKHGKISSGGLQHLAQLKGLEVLNLGRTPVTDEGFCGRSTYPRHGSPMRG